MSKAIEKSKQKVTIERLVWEYNLYWRLMCTDKGNDKNKTILPSPPSTPVTVFLSAEKLLSLWLWILDFQFVFIKVLWKNEGNCMSELFCIGDLLELGRKKHF